MAAVERLVDLYCRLLKVAIAACLAAMVVLVFTNVVMRYLFNSGIPTSEELSRWLLVWLTFLGHCRAAPARPSRRRHPGPRAASARQEDLLHRELCPDALRRLASDAGELEAGGADLRRQRSRVGHLGRPVLLLLRPRL